MTNDIKPQIKTEVRQRYTKDQIGFIKSTFDPTNLMALRKFFLEGVLDENEKEIIKNINKPEVIDFLRLALIPRLDANAPIDELNDLFGGIDPNVNVEYTNYDMEARQISIDYFEGKLGELAQMVYLAKPISINGLGYNRKNKPITNYINLRARNIYIIKHLEFNIKQLKYFYELIEETEEERIERLKKDSVE